jgi:signal transduction histidine kinase
VHNPFPRLRVWLRARPLITDSVLAVVLAAISIGANLLIDREVVAQSQGIPIESLPPADAVTLTVAAVSCLTVALRRRRPFVLLILVHVVDLVPLLLGYPAALSSPASLILLYTVAAYRGLALSLGALLVSLVGYAATALWMAIPIGWADHLVAAGVLVAAWGIGRSIRLRRAYLAELRERADRLERAREADTRAARAEERSRIARELHDVVAHHVSVMTVQAAAAQRVLAGNPEGAREALSAIEELGRTAMAEMRNIVGVLRTDGAPGPAERGPQPGMQDLPALVEQMREAGLRAQLWLEGEPAPLPPGIDLAAYRLVQEALTNTLRHAGPHARAWVTVRQEPRELLVQVEDDGRGLSAPGDRPDGRLTDRLGRLDERFDERFDGAGRAGGDAGGPDGAGGASRRPGHGLMGIRERVALYGGILRIGPRAEGGFEVKARFPLKDA